ncbi:MAG TPA: class I SAM-dependent methyltransferase [Terriglobia bacterium]|nr:class I SAM-dependent methyltransferase [Terriglobia bacterium]
MSCPVCLNPVTAPALTGTDFLFESTSKVFTLHSCSSCRSLFLDPMPDSREIAAFYPAQYWWNASQSGMLKKLESVYRRIALRDHVAFITKAAGGRAGPEILDVGCGSGTLLGLLKQRGFHTRGVDFSAEAARIAKAENGVDVAVGSLEEVHFPDASFDLVTLFHVMEHVTNPRRVLSEVARVLKPNGVVVLQVPNIESWQFKMFGAKWYGLDIPRHVIDYSKNSMEKLLKDSGFVPSRIRHFNLRDNAPALVSSLFPSLDPVSRTVRQRKHNIHESTPLAWSRHAMYLLFVICAYPIALLESAVGRGATVMIEARKE